MNLVETRNKLSKSGKNGVAFLFAGVIIWLIIMIVFLLPLDIYTKNIFMLIASGIMFPLSIAISFLIKSDWQLKDSPLGKLGLYLNLAQIMYFPILFWAIGNSPNEAVMIFAIITGAHFFPYGWLYNAKAYYVMSPVTSVVIMVVGWLSLGQNLWMIPLAVIILLAIMIFALFIDLKKK
ncbi:DUF7010 family protein [Gracilibacillus salinarum]|uniref:EamA domain-containing protein n=1 Tax=Gracilibacillus salinarum TaxID=2932255 RepID=A0ABY4GR49_9BACI|nr:hypothetical protein [Gracilibacillus salinarum]UOQ86876.1 hypothetical protein MUN87_08320 [Gracilibacillus salinarum]